MFIRGDKVGSYVRYPLLDAVWPQLEFRELGFDQSANTPMVGVARCFFFSSRRRHTRFKCDWSSDVCSSDLHLRHRRPAGDRAGGGDLSRQPELFEQPAPPKRRAAVAGEVRPAWDSPLLQAPVLPADIRLGTSSWFFPGWRGLVYDGGHPQVALSRQGLAAYAQIPLLRTVSLDRTFNAPPTAVAHHRQAHPVPAPFSFVV